ncbi:MAG: 30S ribosomal protein S6 [Candidatus Zixiibacteriota bacterium]
MQVYETTFIMDPQLLEEGWEKAISRYSEIITRNGSIRQLERWGLRRLAYTIEKRTQGYYVHVIHESAPGVPRELERQFLLDETCLRYLTVIADNPRYLEEMDKKRAAREEAGLVEGSEPRTDSDSFHGTGAPAEVSDFAEAGAEDVEAEQ